MQDEFEDVKQKALEGDDGGGGGGGGGGKMSAAQKE